MKKNTKKQKCRCKKCVAFRKKYAFEFLDIYGLYHTISEFMVPRLKAFKEHTFSMPCDLKSIQQWHKILDKMILAFDIYAKDNRKKEDIPKVEEGMKLFVEYFGDLWI